MDGADVESAVKIIAENVVFAFERDHDGAGTFLAAGRDMAVAGLMRELLAVMPTEDSDVLAASVSQKTLVVEDYPHDAGALRSHESIFGTAEPFHSPRLEGEQSLRRAIQR